MEVSNIIMHPLPQMTNKGERKMKLSKLREKLENNKELRNKQERKIKRLKAEFKCGVTKEKNRKEEIKIIGITGSSGKTTVANIIHEYLKRLGKKSVLYSSAKIDSPATIIRPDEACRINI